jgi:hypothetical protein
MKMNVATSQFLETNFELLNSYRLGHEVQKILLQLLPPSFRYVPSKSLHSAKDLGFYPRLADPYLPAYFVESQPEFAKAILLTYMTMLQSSAAPYSQSELTKNITKQLASKASVSVNRFGPLDAVAAEVITAPNINDVYKAVAVSALRSSFVLLPTDDFGLDWLSCFYAIMAKIFIPAHVLGDTTLFLHNIIARVMFRDTTATYMSNIGAASEITNPNYIGSDLIYGIGPLLRQKYPRFGLSLNAVYDFLMGGRQGWPDSVVNSTYVHTPEAWHQGYGEIDPAIPNVTKKSTIFLSATNGVLDQVALFSMFLRGLSDIKIEVSLTRS